MATELELKLKVVTEQLKQDLGIIGKFPAEFATATEDAKKKFVEAWQQQKDEVNGVDAALTELHKDADKMTLSTMDKVKGLIANYSEFRQSLLARGGGYEIAGTLMPQQISGVTSAVQHLKSSVLAELPFGGLMGLMLMGAQKFEQVRAQSAEAVRVLEQTGHVGTQYMNRLGKEAYNLGLALGKGPGGMMGELQAAAAGFAEFGAKAEEVAGKSFLSPMHMIDPLVGKTKDGFVEIDESIGATAMRLDSLFKIPAGTTAREAGQISKNFGNSIYEAQEMLAKFGMAARDSHQNVMVFTQGVMASGAVLRNQRIDLNEVAEAQLKLQKAIASTIAPGGSERERMRWASDYAQQGMGQITQGIKGMDLGWATVIGDMLKNTMGANNKPLLETTSNSSLELAFRVKEGLLSDKTSADEQKLIGHTIAKSVELAMKSAGGDKYGARMILGAQFQMDPTGPGTRALLEVAQHSKDPSELKAALDRNKEYIAGAFKDRAQETSNFQRALLLAQDGIARIGIGLLGAVITGIAEIIAAIKWAYFSFTKQEAKAGIQEQALAFYSKQSDKSFAMVGSGLKRLEQAGKIAGETLGEVPGLGITMFDEEAAARKARAPNLGVMESVKKTHPSFYRWSGMEGIQTIGEGVGYMMQQGYLPDVSAGGEKELAENAAVIAKKRKELERKGKLVSRRTTRETIDEQFVADDAAGRKAPEAHKGH